MELFNGDIVSLVNEANIPKEDNHLVKKLNVTYQLYRLEGEDTAKFDDVKKEPVTPGEILVQTYTEPIQVDSDSETEENVVVKKVEQPQQQQQPLQANGVVKKVVRFRDDYEEGEPSRIPRPPTPPKTDPVSIVRHFFQTFTGSFPNFFLIIKHSENRAASTIYLFHNKIKCSC